MFFLFVSLLHYSLYQHVIGMVKNQRLPANIITPTTKAVDHDVPVTPDEVYSTLLNALAFSNFCFFFFMCTCYLLSLKISTESDIN